jgi:hypothetical protein
MSVWTRLETYGHVTSRMGSSGVAHVATFLNGPPQVVRDSPSGKWRLR